MVIEKLLLEACLRGFYSLCAFRASRTGRYPRPDHSGQIIRALNRTPAEFTGKFSEESGEVPAGGHSVDLLLEFREELQLSQQNQHLALGGLFSASISGGTAIFELGLKVPWNQHS